MEYRLKSKRSNAFAPLHYLFKNISVVLAYNQIAFY